MADEKKSPDERKAILARQLQTLVAQGRRIESQSDYTAVVVRKRFGRDKKEMVSIDDWGVPSIQKL